MEHREPPVMYRGEHGWRTEESEAASERALVACGGAASASGSGRGGSRLRGDVGGGAGSGTGGWGSLGGGGSCCSGGPRGLPSGGGGGGADTGAAGEPDRPADPLMEPSAAAVRSLDTHFDKVFAALGPDHATARYLRRRLAAELLLHVEQRSRVEQCSKQAVCSRAVLAALRMHERFLDNADVHNVKNRRRLCVNSKYHNLLYAVAKLCFDCRLLDSEVVCELLKAIFYCERSLDNLIVGALLGVVSTHVFNAWKSDFESRQENLQALDYFLERASRGRLRFDPRDVADDEDDEPRPMHAGAAALAAAPGVAKQMTASAVKATTEASTRFTVPCVSGVSRGCTRVGLADLPLRAYGKLRPLALAVLLANAEAVLLLLRHGARPVDASPLYAWYGRRVADDNLAGCVRVLLRAVPWVLLVEQAPETPGAPLLPDLDAVPSDLVVFAKGSPEAALVPQERLRGAAPPPPLKHLARCCARAALRRAGRLPHGLDLLELPSSLHTYLDLLED